jgi:uncharacterized protein (DUF433 family)
MEIRHPKFDRITIDPKKCFGKPCIRGLRIPVASILAYLSSGMTFEEVLREWPELQSEDIHQALMAQTADLRILEEARANDEIILTLVEILLTVRDALAGTIVIVEAGGVRMRRLPIA